MFAVHTQFHTCKPRGKASLERCEVAGMDDIGRKAAEQPSKLRIEPETLSRWLAKSVVLYVVTQHAIAKVRDLGKRHDRMAICLFRKPIDQIDYAIFQAPDVETKHHVRNQGTRISQVVV